MHLSENHIKFIDQYLLKIGIEFYDVRLELIDHIASTFEQDEAYKNLPFSESIRLYHIQNKEFLYSNRFYHFNALRMIWYNKADLLSIFKQILRPFFWISFLSVFFIVKNDFIRLNIGLNAFDLLVVLFCVMFVTQFFFQKILLKKRFKSVEIRSYFLTLIFMIFNPLIQLISHSFWSQVINLTAIAVILMYMLSSFPLYLNNYKKYNTIS